MLTSIPYTARRTVAEQLQVVEIAQLQVPKCEKCGELLFTAQVDEQITNAFLELKSDVRALAD